jgi:hypothetical protein
VQGPPNAIPPCGSSPPGCAASPVGTEIVLPTAECSSGQKALGGGYTIANGETVIVNAPTAQDNGWNVTVLFTDPHATTGTDRASAVCGSP